MKIFQLIRAFLKQSCEGATRFSQTLWLSGLVCVTYKRTLRPSSSLVSACLYLSLLLSNRRPHIDLYQLVSTRLDLPWLASPPLRKYTSWVDITILLDMKFQVFAVLMDRLNKMAGGCGSLGLCRVSRESELVRRGSQRVPKGSQRVPRGSQMDFRRSQGVLQVIRVARVSRIYRAPESHRFDPSRLCLTLLNSSLPPSTRLHSSRCDGSLHPPPPHAHWSAASNEGFTNLNIRTNIASPLSPRNGLLCSDI